MPTRRQEKVARFIKETVSDAIANHLSDPRIDGFISVTRVEVTADLRSADVYISIFGSDETAQNKTFTAMTHATPRIQALLADQMQSKFRPVLHILKDDNFKKTMETMSLIEKAVSEIKDRQVDSSGTQQDDDGEGQGYNEKQ